MSTQVNAILQNQNLRTDLRPNLSSTKVNASPRKSSQAYASGWPNETQVLNASPKLASTCESVWPGLRARGNLICLHSEYALTFKYKNNRNSSVRIRSLSDSLSLCLFVFTSLSVCVCVSLSVSPFFFLFSFDRRWRNFR